jgi:hypothetical protein
MRPMINLLLRLYPPRWRARYGDEFAAVLEERPLGPFDVADVLLGALDAHLHLRGLGAASQHAKGFAMSLRIGGYAAIVGGVLWLVALTGNAINAGAESGAEVIGLVIVAATISTLVALVGLSAFQARRHPRLVWAAFTIPAIGGIIVLLGVVGMAVTGDSDAPLVGGLDGWVISSLGLLTLLVGSVLFAIATWRTRALSRGAAATLGFGSIVIVPVLAGVLGGIVPEALALPALAVAILAFPLGWMALGVSALRVRPGSIALEGASL